MALILTELDYAYSEVTSPEITPKKKMLNLAKKNAETTQTTNR